MADVKISALPAASTPLAGTEVLPIVQGGTTNKVSVANLTAGRTVDAAAVVVGAGNVSVPSVTFSGDTNTGIYSPAADTIAFTNGGTERMRINAVGNVGIGTATPAVWFGATVHAQNLGSGATFRASGSSVIANFFSAEGLAYAAIGTQSNHSFLFNTNDTERMRIDTSGNVGIGTSAPVTPLHVAGSITTGGNQIGKYLARNSVNIPVMDLGIGTGTGFGDSIGLYNLTSSGLISFGTNNTERARITSAGDWLVAKTTNADTTVGSAMLTNGRVTSTMAASTAADSSYHLYSTGAGAYRFYVDLSGRIAATNTTIAAISDQRLKENIRDLDAGLPEVMALKPRKFDWKPGKGKDKKDDQGWIAQEFEQVFPDMITEWKDPAPEGEEPYKAVGADLIPVLVKAIQQQQAQIEELKARVAALEAK